MTSFKYSSYIILWFVGNAIYYRIFFSRYPCDHVRAVIPAMGVLLNIPITILMMANTPWSLSKAKDLGFYYTIFMFFVFLFAGLFLAARIPSHHYTCADNPAFCVQHKTREIFLALVHGLEVFLVFGGLIFLEILRTQIISSQFLALLRQRFNQEDLERGEEESSWI
ncbi:unnamed protein product [Caenorhabditis nigoni]